MAVEAPEAVPDKAPRNPRVLRAALAVGIVAAVAVGYWGVRKWRTDTLNAYEQKCIELLAQEKWDELEVVATQWSDLEPDSGSAWLYRADAAEAKSRWSEMAACLERVPATDSRRVPALIRKAIADFESLNKPWEGLKTCDEVLKQEPRILIAHKQSIFFCAMTLQRGELVRRVREAIRQRRESPESYVYLVSASWLYSGALYKHNDHWLKGDPNSEVFEVARAMQIYTSQAKNDLERAPEFEHIPPPEEMLKKYPHNQELVAMFLGRAVLGGDVDAVRELLARVPSEIADADARFWRARGWLQDAEGDTENAEKSLRIAFARDPYWWQLHYQLHDLLRRAGKLEESEKFLAIYKVSHDLAIMIMTLNRTEDGFTDPKFSQLILTLAELLGDNDVASVLKERVRAGINPS